MTKSASKIRKRNLSNELKHEDCEVVPLNLNRTEFSLLVTDEDGQYMSQGNEIEMDLVISESTHDKRPKYCGKTNRSISQSSELSLLSFRPERPQIRRKKECMVGPMRLSHRLSQRITRCGLSPLKSPIIARTLRFSDIKGNKTSKEVHTRRKSY